jgi:hypothetical protein
MENSNSKIIVNGKEVTEQELAEMRSNPRKRLKKLNESTNEYIVLERLEG